jgi:hypothetical protein
MVKLLTKNGLDELVKYADRDNKKLEGVEIDVLSN